MAFVTVLFAAPLKKFPSFSLLDQGVLNCSITLHAFSFFLKSVRQKRGFLFCHQNGSNNAFNLLASHGISEGPLPSSVGVWVRVSVGVLLGMSMGKMLLMFFHACGFQERLLGMFAGESTS